MRRPGVNCARDHSALTWSDGAKQACVKAAPAARTASSTPTSIAPNPAADQWPEGGHVSHHERVPPPAIGQMHHLIRNRREPFIVSCDDDYATIVG
jgi:hypothetical protein